MNTRLMCEYIYIYVCVCTCIGIYAYVYIYINKCIYKDTHIYIKAPINQLCVTLP